MTTMTRHSTYVRLLEPGDRFIDEAGIWTVSEMPEIDERRRKVRVRIVGRRQAAVFDLNHRVRLYP